MHTTRSEGYQRQPFILDPLFTDLFLFSFLFIYLFLSWLIEAHWTLIREGRSFILTQQRGLCALLNL